MSMTSLYSTFSTTDIFCGHGHLNKKALIKLFKEIDCFAEISNALLMPFDRVLLCKAPMTELTCIVHNECTDCKTKNIMVLTSPDDESTKEQCNSEHILNMRFMEINAFCNECKYLNKYILKLN